MQDTKAPIANPTFTGAVNGITKAMVGLGNVDNTSDANKPISTAVANALSDKVDAIDPILYGEIKILSEDDYDLLSIEDVEEGQRGKLNIGQLVLHNIQEFADNAAAISGGLMAGEIYRTTTGVVMCVFDAV